MRYINEDFYRNKHGGTYDGAGLKALILRAEGLADALTYGRIRAAGFENLTKFQKAAVKRACCLMVDYFTNVDGQPSADVQSYSVADMRVYNRKRRERPWEVAGCGMWAWMELLSTGLMQRKC
ncbi:MAG: hypothetical protein LBE35_06770 [Clostridiales bacterium]|jgi:hypothetical protein|nr:hypothetical protein [Clostridiales bacterium]